jgi:excisionase family DNA binding protein
MDEKRMNEMVVENMSPPDVAVPDQSSPFLGDRLTCSVDEACEAVGLGRTKFYELLNGGAVQSVLVGRRRLVNVSSLKRLTATETGRRAAQLPPRQMG